MPCLGVSAAKGALLLNLCQRSSASMATQQPVVLVVEFKVPGAVHKAGLGLRTPA